MSRIAFARKTIVEEKYNFFLGAGHRILLDDVHLNGEVAVPEVGMVHLPFKRWMSEGYLEDEGESQVQMETYEYSIVDLSRYAGEEDGAVVNLEPMFHNMLQSSTMGLWGAACMCLVGAEVGVYMGENAEKILRCLPVKKLYLIDSYEENPDYQPGNPHLKEAKELAHQRLERYGDIVVWIYESSQVAVPKLHDLDFLYHDSDHRRPCVESELPLGYEAVKPGGWWGGHDYKQTLKGGCDVKSCVDEFFIRRNLTKLYYSATMLNWWTRKCSDSVFADCGEKKEGNHVD